MAETISQIGRHGRKGASHLRNPAPWHKPSRKSGCVPKAGVTNPDRERQAWRLPERAGRRPEPVPCYTITPPP
ncbi:MAG: hypothetical protein J6D54_06420, partial [Olsenella sp.]|nr:hypothetical protein [Olsenella sp.]